MKTKFKRVIIILFTTLLLVSPLRTLSQSINSKFLEDFTGPELGENWLKFPISVLDPTNTNGPFASHFEINSGYASFVAANPSKPTDRLLVSTREVSLLEDWDLTSRVFLIDSNSFGNLVRGNKIGIAMGIALKRNPYKGCDVGIRWRVPGQVPAKEIYANIDNQGARSTQVVAVQHSLANIFVDLAISYRKSSGIIQIGYFNGRTYIQLASFSPEADWGVGRDSSLLIGVRGYSSRVDAQAYTVGVDDFQLSTSSAVAEQLVIEPALKLQFKTLNGKYYRLQKSTDLTSWSSVDDLFLGDGSEFLKYHPQPDSKPAFFRIEILNP